jgi:formylglycine-generating enzyme required for sulfatase activity
VIVIDTDLPVPPDPNASTTSTAFTLADAARVEIVKAGTLDLACAEASDCQRDFAIDEGVLRRHEVSFGLVPMATDVDVRVRLFTHGIIDAYGQPLVGDTDEVRAHAVFPRAGVQTETIVVPGDAWGTPGASSPFVDGVLGPAPESVVGTWEKTRPTPCALAPRADTGALDGEQCIHGATFPRGGLKDPLISVGYAGDLREPRLVQISPFLLDTYELTLERYAAITLPPGIAPPATYSKDPSVPAWRASCTLGAPNASSHLPLNCVSPETAEAICEAIGKRLPTDTEIELAATGFDDRFFPWGNRSPFEPSNADPNQIIQCCAGVAVSRQTPAAAVTGVVFDECTTQSAAAPDGPFGIGPEPVDAILGRALLPECAGVRDVSAGGVVGLGANVSEWTQDYFSTEEGACWSATTLVKDPVCKPPIAPTPFHVFSGGNWYGPSGESLVGIRGSDGSDPVVPEIAVGIRCARTATGAP